MRLANILENHYKDMQDMEFTIQEGKLYFLQTRNGKRTASAAINIACDLVDEGMITTEEAVLRIEAKSLDQLLHPMFDTTELKNGEEFPQDPKEQLMGAVKAVFRSWDNPRAIVYRRMNDIPGDWGTAVNFQAMVFGNMGETSGTGVAFTRNPSTGEKGIKFDTELTVEDLKELVRRFKSVYSEHMNGSEFPQDAKEQLMGAVKAVFISLDNPRAIVYRRMNDIPGDWGTAVNVQAMVFGNM